MFLDFVSSVVILNLIQRQNADIAVLKTNDNIINDNDIMIIALGLMINGDI